MYKMLTEVQYLDQNEHISEKFAYLNPAWPVCFEEQSIFAFQTNQSTDTCSWGNSRSSSKTSKMLDLRNGNAV